MAKDTMPLSRDSLSSDSFKQAMLDEAPGEMGLMDPDAFEASRQKILREAEKAGEFWVFAYGSLIWNPIIEVAEVRPAHLSNHGRRFCVWAPIGRGSPDCQGLWLGLDKLSADVSENAICYGQALRIEPEKWDAESLILWRREMISGVYIPEWLNVEIAGKPTQCCVFVANPEHERYATDVAWKDQVKAIAYAEGSLGTCRDYLYSLAEQLNKAEMSDRYIEQLIADVRAERESAV